MAMRIQAWGLDVIVMVGVDVDEEGVEVARIPSVAQWGSTASLCCIYATFQSYRDMGSRIAPQDVLENRPARTAEPDWS